MANLADAGGAVLDIASVVVVVSGFAIIGTVVTSLVQFLRRCGSDGVIERVPDTRVSLGWNAPSTWGEITAAARLPYCSTYRGFTRYQYKLARRTLRVYARAGDECAFSCLRRQADLRSYYWSSFAAQCRFEDVLRPVPF